MLWRLLLNTAREDLGNLVLCVGLWTGLRSARRTLNIVYQTVFTYGTVCRMFSRVWGQSYVATMLYICKSVDMAVVVTCDIFSSLDTSPARKVLESLNGLHRSWTLIVVRKLSCSTS